MGVALNPITVGWIGGIGVAAIIASLLLVHSKTRNWSENRIFLVSLLSAVVIMLILMRGMGMV